MNEHYREGRKPECFIEDALQAKEDGRHHVASALFECAEFAERTADAAPALKADPNALPEQTIILDRDLAKRFPEKAFYLRITHNSHHIEHVDLDGQHTLPGAVRAADALGYAPTHWMEVGHSFFSEIPTSIVRVTPAAPTAPKGPSI